MSPRVEASLIEHRITKIVTGFAVAALALAACGKRETPDGASATATASAAAPARPTSSFSPAPAPSGEWNTAQIDWQTYDIGLQRAQQAHKPICLVVSTTWCPHCKNFSRVFDDPRVVARAQDFVMIHVDSDAEPEVAARHAVDGGYIPRTFFLGTDGKVAASIHPTRPRFLYFYDERDPGSLLDGMATALRTLKPG